MSTTPVVLKDRIRKRLDGLTSVIEAISPDESGVTLEIGCGHGHFLTSYARAHPEETCIGLDLLSGRVARSERKRKASGLENLHFVCAEAWEWLTVWPDSVPIHKVWILFPDPWPKTRHENRRLVSNAFLYLLDMRMSEEARIYFRTDYIPYLEWVSERITGHSRWELTGDAFPFEERTVFEARASSYGSIVARKKRLWESDLMIADLPTSAMPVEMGL